MTELWASNRFEPLSITAAAPGWRAKYDSLDSEKGYRIVPLIGWAVYRVSVVGRESGDQELLQGNVIEGVVPQEAGGSPICALELDGFAGYLSPDEDPDTVDPKGGLKPPGYRFKPPTRLHRSRRAA